MQTRKNSQKYWPLLVLMFAIAGCTSVQWSRPNTSDAQQQRDSQNCQNKAMSVNQVVKLQPGVPGNANATVAAQTEWQTCMRSLGYTAKQTTSKN